MTIAHHSSALPDGTPGGNPGGFLLTLADARIYFAGDTALFADMQLYGRGGLDLAILPIGDLFTMGPEDSIEAIKLLNPDHVAPCHYNTWPPIAQDAAAWAAAVRSQTSAQPHTPKPGGAIELA
jgi:L-ascorbate metabolism protein UlaG (beta-lactamase superfamily)